MTDEVSPAGPQMVCGPGECERANRLVSALDELMALAHRHEYVSADLIIPIVEDALEDQ